MTSLLLFCVAAGFIHSCFVLYVGYDGWKDYPDF